MIWLTDRLKTTRFRVKYNLLDDLDYFTFPRKYINHKSLADNEDMMDDQYYRLEKKLLFKKLASTRELLLNFVRLYQAGVVKFPRALYLVD